MSLEGQQIDRYRILRLLGSGGMGDVYLAEDARIEQQVAIKVIRAEVSPQASQEGARLFQREAKAIAKLDHPYILPLYDYGEESVGNMTIIYLVMPYRQEGSLIDWLRQHGQAGMLMPKEVVHFIGQAASALQHAHDRQIIHQDVKPSNFLLRYRQETPTRPDLLLADFGIARLATATASTSQSIRGTPTYMAPEQWEGYPVLATDQYALAIMAFELLTRRPPFQGAPGSLMYQHLMTPVPPPSSVNPRLSGDLDAVLVHALAKLPEQRFASISAFANAFKQAVQTMPVAGAPVRQVVTPAPVNPVAPATGAPTVKNTNQQALPARPFVGQPAETIPQGQSERQASVLRADRSSRSPDPVTPQHRSFIEERSLSTYQPPERGISRRTVVAGLAVLAGAGVTGVLLWLTRSQQPAAPTLSNHVPGGSVRGSKNLSTYMQQSQQTVQLAAITQMQILNKVGDTSITVDPTVTASTVTTVKKVQAGSNADAHNEFGRISVQVQADSATNTLTVSVALPDTSSNVLINDSDAVDVTITLPPSVVTNTTGPLRLNANTSTRGNVLINGLNGVLVVKDGVGNVTVRHSTLADGSHLETGKGDIVFDGALDTTGGANPQPMFKIQVEIGNVDVSLPATTNVILDANVNVGSIRSDFPITVTSTVGSPSYYGPLMSSATPPKAVLVMDVSSGNIDLHQT